MNRYKKEAILIFSIVSLAAYAAGELPHSHDMELVQSVSRGYYVSMSGEEGVNIGKVYEDLNGDGYQADATAENIVIRGGVDTENYIPDTTVIYLGDNSYEVDGKPLMEDGLEIDALQGISKIKRKNSNNKAIIRFETTQTNWKALEVISNEGSHIVLDSSGKSLENHVGNVDKGLAGENIKITRNVYKKKGKERYLQEIIVENLGVYEEGIPGVRLITLDGVMIETDIHGRYRIPDEWIVKSEGKNYLIKLDESTLPDGMKVISENPKIKRITPHGLNRINFSVQNESEESESND